MTPLDLSASATWSMSTLISTSSSSIVTVAGRSSVGSYVSIVTMALFDSLFRASTSDASIHKKHASTMLALMTNSA